MTADRPDRFFPTTLLGGFLHVWGIPDWGPWNDGRIEYAHESFVDAILRPETRDRKLRTPEEFAGGAGRTPRPCAVTIALAACEPVGRSSPSMGDDVRRTREPSIP